MSNGAIVWTRSYPHEGNPREALAKALADIPDLASLRVAATGRKFRSHLAISNIAEPEAVELAMQNSMPKDHPYRIVVSAGAETFMAYYIGSDNRIQSIHTGNKCASGTGEFFLQQLGRMDITLDDVAGMEMPETFHKVSGRCSVFCKSDCTHALNKGIPRPQVVGGLARMMAGKIVELVRKMPKSPVMLIGGCASNRHMTTYLSEEIPDLRIAPEAACFEALGAACWASNHETIPVTSAEAIFAGHGSTFSFLKPLSESRGLVEFKNRPSKPAQAGDVTLMGLDVGSTTTKGVIVRRSDKAILAADYLRTNGDPVGASRRVYASLAKQINVPITIEALGVTGSGRQIAGLHAMTDGVINEIVAHATAAVYFDPQVDTIFEIGGQDAKYTYITNGVPSDYAMNEACSAGTGSFLEESAKESLGLDVTAIGKTALDANAPLNFNDQCAAFIGSDIKGAIQEGVSTENIVAGLVYSVCMNYINRVKGNRPVGKKVFMQGGVCYNEAVPVAIASLTGKAVVVPPEPGLMGAFGVALEVERRMEQGWIQPGSFDLNALAAREVTNLEPFRCKGGIDKCDLRCEIARIEIDGKIYPFGGICNRYDNLSHKGKVESADHNLVIKRERRLFRDLEPDNPDDKRPTMGLSRSFLTNNFFPFYRRLFAELGFRVVLPDGLDPAGFDLQGAAFCFPAELAHGYAARLLARKPDYIFLPHVRAYPSGGKDGESCTCVFVQGEPYYLRAAFSEMDPSRVLSPILNFNEDASINLKALEEMAATIGVDPSRVASAIGVAQKDQHAFHEDLLEMGKNALTALEADPDRIAVVLFGRAYNSFTLDANKGIPAKLASRGVTIIPFDMLPAENESLESDHNMYWASGRLLLKAAHFVKKHPRLFGTYITNFSCGPDSFLVRYFRDIMGRKPSLTLELDNHTADAGLETRIEAFLDIVQYYRQLGAAEKPKRKSDYRPARTEVRNGCFGVQSSSGEWMPLTDPRVVVALPAMGRFGTAMLARVFESMGIRARVIGPADEEILKIGRGHSSCKECLPLQTTIGSIIHYLQTREKGEVTAYFMASTEGPCRFGQYHVLSKRVLDELEIPDVAVLSLTTTNGYAGLGDKFALAAWRAIILGDIFLDMWSAILAGAEDRESALKIFHRERETLLSVIGLPWRKLKSHLKAIAGRLAEIKLKKPFREIPKIALVGEIYVRQDPISLQNLLERLGDRGFIVRVSQTAEWIKYLDWLTKKRIDGKPDLGFWIRYAIKNHLDRKIRQALAPSGLFELEAADVDPVMDAGGRYVSPFLTGEAILTVGSALHEILHPACGVIAIGPFGCMPTRVAESILNTRLNTGEKRAIMGKNGHDGVASILEGDRRFPFLAIETDGRPFPQVIEARLETFCLQAHRLNDEMLAGKHAETAQ
jgi:predicted CoA-substrate-specific enzyme activase